MTQTAPTHTFAVGKKYRLTTDKSVFNIRLPIGAECVIESIDRSNGYCRFLLHPGVGLQVFKLATDGPRCLERIYDDHTERIRACLAKRKVNRANWKPKVGDKVRIRQWDDMEKEFGLDSAGDIKCLASFTRSMRNMCGNNHTVLSVDESDESAILDGDISHWITNDMIEPI